MKQTLKQYVSQIVGYRIKEGDEGWDEMSKVLSQNGTWSITGSPKKFQDILIEVCKRIDTIEHETV